MQAQLPRPWLEILASLDHAFQPIASLADGSAYGFEALLRGWEGCGFTSIAEVFDRAYEERILYALDLALREKAFRKFAGRGLERAKLFYNVDNRLLQMPDYSTGNTGRLAAEAALAPSRIVIELSELHEPDQRTGFDRVVAAYRGQGCRIALDDFGTGYAGLKFLYRAEPDIVKIDRFFVAGAADDPRKASFLERIAGLAHLMGVSVIAEGVETERELRLCMEAGCDYVQGYYIARPSVAASDMAAAYPRAASAARGYRRSASRGGRVGAADLLATEPVELGLDLASVLARFRKEPELSILPVVDGEGEPVGAYRARDFLQYLYSPFGISLLEHQIAEGGSSSLVARIPVVASGTELGRVVELYGANPECGGVIATEGGRYAGVLPAESLLALVADLELAEARDQNPLTRLPGNLRVSEVCAERLAEPGEGVAFVYYDFDNFKPFNDRYGFRSGDRVIMLFADILKSSVARPKGFIGHLGGDDFFACLESADPDQVLEEVKATAGRFAREASSFYAPADRERGWIKGRDRSGRERRMSLLTVSAALVHLRPGASLDAEGLSEALALLKKEAKASPSRLAFRSFGPGPEEERGIAAGGSGGPRAAPASLEAPASPPIFSPSLILA